MKGVRRPLSANVSRLIHQYKHAKDTHDEEGQRDLLRDLTRLEPEWTPETIDKLADFYGIYGVLDDDERYWPDP